MRTAAVIVLLSLTGPLPAQEKLQVLQPEKDGLQPRKMLYSYLLGQAQKQFDARRQAVAALKTPDDLKRRQQELKAKFIEALGGFPEKTPLNARTVGTLQGDGFRVEKVIYESLPDHHVTAALYLPEGKGPFPGVLVPCGHSANGKAAEAYQRACILLAKNGMAALCYDPIGQGERIQILDAKGKPAVAGSTSEHTMVGVGALLVGRSTASYRIWDGIRSLDYLVARPEIDAGRLGCTGNSGGGTMTAYLMALDDRIACAAPSCYITSLERLFATIGPQDAEQNITGQVAFGMEHADYLTMRAPRPTLVCTATQDFFDIQGAWTSFREASLLYGMIGHGERVAMFEYNDKHGFSKPRREAAMRWMRRWLLHKDDAPVEGKFPVFTDQELQCTRSGQVLEDFKGKSVVTFNAEAARELAGQRAKLQASRGREQLLGEVRRLIGLEKDPAPAKVVSKEGVGKHGGCDVTKLVFATEAGILVPGLLYTPLNPLAKEPLQVYLDGRGMAAAVGSSKGLETLARLGRRVLALDLRGFGETAPGPVRPDRPNLLGADQKEVFLGLHLNRPLLGQRVHDLLAVLGAVKDQTTAGVHVLGVGAAGPVALHAAAFDPRITQVSTDQAIVSWDAVARAPINHNQLTNVVPGALKRYDLPELAALVAPRPLMVMRAVDPVGQELSQRELEHAYAACTAAYQKAPPSRLLLQGGR